MNGEGFDSAYLLTDVWVKHQPGDSVELTIERPHVPEPFVVRAALHPFSFPAESPGGYLLRGIIHSFLCYGYGFMVLGLVSLARDGLRASTPAARRRIGVIFWGTRVGLVPLLLYLFPS